MRSGQLGGAGARGLANARKARAKATQEKGAGSSGDRRKASPGKPKPSTTASAAPRRLPPEARRAQILQVAAALFVERPYDAIGIADVANGAGITQGLLYHYFESKERLFAAAVEASARELLRACLPDQSLPLPEQFELGVRGYLDFVEAHRVAYSNLFHGPAATEPELQRVADGTRQAIIEHVVGVMGLSEHEIPATRLSLRGYIGYAESAILQWVDTESVPRATLERLIFAVIITALRMGLQSDPDVPLRPDELAEFEHAYKRHFHLP